MQFYFSLFPFFFAQNLISWIARGFIFKSELDQFDCS